MLPILLSTQKTCCVSCSPIGYRIGFGSPTRLVRLGFASGEASVKGYDAAPGDSGEVLTSVSMAALASSPVFFFRPRFGGAAQLTVTLKRSATRRWTSRLAADMWFWQ